MANSIPNFDHNLVLPPHLGDPRQRDDLSPYPCSTHCLVEKFSTSSERIEILRGFLKFRKYLKNEGLTNGYQWLDGSFLENIETLETRSPRDLDVITVYWGYDINFTKKLVQKFPEFADRASCKANFHLDHFPLDAGYHPEVTVNQTRYWIQLFTHNRSGIWKGMLRIDLDTPIDDSKAEDYLNQKVHS